MLKLIVLALFGWMSYKALRLTFRVAKGVAKTVATILFILALPTLIGCLVYASGFMLLLPLAIVGAAWGILGLF